MAEVQKDKLGSREDTLRFLDMVGLFSSQAMIALGKLANPTTGKAEKNLGVARLFIDTLEMLERKTQGNLTPDETKVLQATLTDLRLIFIDESKEPAAAPAPTPAPPTEPSHKAPKSEEPKTDDSKVKFQKKYD